MTPEQKAIMQADIIAKQQPGQPLEGITNEPLIAAHYNALTATKGWRTEVPTKTVRAAITLSSYTPNDAADGTATFTNRALVAQNKQINLQLMLQGLDTIDASLPQARADLRDAVIKLPTGAAGALVSASGVSGVNVLTACTRFASVGELVVATEAQGSDTTGTVTARVFTWQGTFSDQLISDIILGR